MKNFETENNVKIPVLVFDSSEQNQRFFAKNLSLFGKANDLEFDIITCNRATKINSTINNVKGKGVIIALLDTHLINKLASEDDYNVADYEKGDEEINDGEEDQNEGSDSKPFTKADEISYFYATTIVDALLEKDILSLDDMIVVSAPPTGRTNDDYAAIRKNYGSAINVAFKNKSTIWDELKTAMGQILRQKDLL